MEGRYMLLKFGENRNWNMERNWKIWRYWNFGNLVIIIVFEKKEYYLRYWSLNFLNIYDIKYGGF